ncbi:hypothetical protein D9B58_19290 [Serratia marcescens]|nr:hypothetical protein D9B63_11310 [Serratia marcescens]RTG51277.1 hypothetical protein D9B58_19290 [Serratia marcescens]
MTRLTMLPDLTPPAYKNKENQFIDFRLIITKGEKPRFFPLCLQPEGRPAPLVIHAQRRAPDFTALKITNFLFEATSVQLPNRRLSF